MGRGTSKASAAGGGTNRLLSQVTDNLDFRAWIKENLSNPEFKQFGKENHMDAVKDLWYEKRAQEELKNLHEMDIEDAIDQVRGSIPNQTLHNWFIEANSDVKPHLVDYIMSNPGTLNAGLNIAYQNYKNDLELKAIKGSTEKPMSFDKWVNTPQTVYRGDRGQGAIKSDIFMSFTPDKRIAAGFTLSDSGMAASKVKSDFSNIDMSKITTIKIKPKDTWGSYFTTGEQEFLVPIKKVKRK